MWRSLLKGGFYTGLFGIVSGSFSGNKDMVIGGIILCFVAFVLMKAFPERRNPWYTAAGYNPKQGERATTKDEWKRIQRQKRESQRSGREESS